MTHSTMRTLVPALLSAALAGCLTAEPPPTTADQTGAISAGDSVRTLFERDLLAADAERSRLASRDGFVEAVLAFTAPDAAYLAINQPILHGRTAIAALLDADDPAHGRRATFDPRRVTVSADGLLGNTFGWNVFTTTAPDGSITTSFGKYCTVWRRQGLRWRAVVHVQNATGFTPSPAPDSFPLLDDEPPVIRLADPRHSAAQIAATDRAFAAMSVASGSGPAFPAFADEDAVEIAGPIIYGIDEVAANHAGDLPPSEELLDWAPADAGASFTGDLGYTIGNYVDTAGADVAFGKYLTVWERDTDGSWKWTADMGNPSPAPAP